MIYDYTINNFIKSILPSKNWLGVFPRDMFPYKTIKHATNTTFCIVNLDNYGEPGSHFIAIVKHKSALYIYDSLGNQKHYDMLQPLLQTLCQQQNLKLWTNLKQHQSYKSNACGYFCTWFILFFYFKKNCITFNNIDKHIMKNLKTTKTQFNESYILNDLIMFIKRSVVEDLQNDLLNSIL